MKLHLSQIVLGLFIAGAAACSSSSSGNNGTSSGGDAQTPPTTKGADVEAWIKGGAYKSWHCETALHAARSPSPHGFNRVCSNNVINGAAGGTAAWPQGAASVKELFASATDTTPGGYAVAVKTAADSAGGGSWYWYERTPDGTIYADGMGSSGDAKSICVGCHVASGSDTAHTPVAGGHDFVYTPVH